MLDCGCGAGRFARMAADRGARVAGIDAAEDSSPSPLSVRHRVNFRAGDLEALPWPDASFDVVTGFNAFQFADDKSHALAEARRVSHGAVAVVIPIGQARSRVLLWCSNRCFPLFRTRGTGEHEAQRHLCPVGTGEARRDARCGWPEGLSDDNEIELSIIFDTADAAERAFVGAGPTELAIRNSGEQAVAQAVRDASLVLSSARMVASPCSPPGTTRGASREPDPDGDETVVSTRAFSDQSGS